MATIYLGIGAQKAGTSWLYHQLKRGEAFRQGLGKEYHVLDSLFRPGLDDFTKVFSDELVALRERKEQRAHERSALQRVLAPLFALKERRNPTPTQRAIARKERLLDMIAGKENYYDYIASRLGAPDTFTADFTPSYSALSAEHLADVRREFDRRGIQVKVIFILREPVCRLESAVRMGMRNEGRLTEDGSASAAQRMLTYGGSAHERTRSNYPEVVENLEAVFPREDVLIEFYERLFEPASLAAVAGFCGLDPDSFETDRYYNQSASHFTYPREVIDELVERYRHIYGFVEQRFDFDLGLWTESRARLLQD